jgi:hypothetical protein
MSSSKASCKKKQHRTKGDAPPHFLKDSNASSKIKTSKERIGVRSLAHITSGVKGACWSSGMGIRKSDKQVNYSHGPTQTEQQVG